MGTISAHRRQFVIAPRPVRSEAGWIARELGCGHWLSTCPHLRVTDATDAEGERWFILGLAIQSDASRADPAQEIAAARTQDVPTLSDEWGGRYVLVGPGIVETDAAGLLGVYYRVLGRSEVWISSSPVLLAKLPSASAAEDTRVLRHPRAVNWFPLPESRYAGIFKQTPSQRLRWHGGRAELTPRPLAARIDEAAEYDTLLDDFGSRLQTLASRLPQARLWLPLTGGFDSRLLLSLVTKVGLRPTAYTQTWKHLSVADRVFSARMAADTGTSHRLFGPHRRNRRHERMVDDHTGRHVSDVDRMFIAHGQWEFCRFGDLALRGGGFELARLHFWRRFKKLGPRQDWPNARELAAAFFAEPDDPAVADFERWLAWVQEHPQPGVPWIDRFYIEQRLGGWLSGIEHMLDTTEMERVYLINCRAIFGDLLRVPLDLRSQARPHRDLIQRWAPRLMEYPVNPTDSSFSPRTVFWARTRNNPTYPARALVKKLLGRASRTRERTHATVVQPA